MNIPLSFGRGFLAAGLVLFSESSFSADDPLRGAEAVLKRVSEAAKQEPGDKSKIELLTAEIESFGKSGAAMPPEEAARAWLTLVDRAALVTPDELSEVQSRDLDQDFSTSLLKALPPPAAWPALEKAVVSRPAVKGAKAVPELALRMIAHTLAGNLPARRKVLDDLNDAFAKDKSGSSNRGNELTALLIASSDDPALVLKLLDQQIAATGRGGSEVRLPDLVTTIGAEKAEAFLRRALTQATQQLVVSHGEETRKLAQRLALELVDKLKVPQWKLAESIDATKLYEGLQKRFALGWLTALAAPFGGSMGQNQQAQLYYLLGLIAKGRTDDALKVAESFGQSGSEQRSSNLSYSFSAPLEALERAGYVWQLNDFLHRLLSKNPALPFWENYVQVAARAGDVETMLTLARSVAARPEMAGAEQASFRSIYYKALLAADQVDEALVEMRKQMGAARKPEDYSDPRTETALKIAKLGMLLDRKELIEEGLAAARAAATDNTGQREDAGSLASLLLALGRHAEAEKAIEDGLVRAAGRPASEHSFEDSESRSLLSLLALIYHEAGREADVLALLERAPGWGAKDLAEFFAETISVHSSSEYSSHAPMADTNVGWLAASAFAARGEKERALKIVNALLDRDGGFDPGYELLHTLQGDAAMARLDELFARDQFEERPLIWKAFLLLKAGKLEEAEKTIRRAIFIDPSDGEQGPGRRMRAYAVLADISEAQGKADEAKTMRGAVTAIRLSEKADRFYEAGLLSRAVAMYEEALKHFSDAYCIQSRLALRMAELGRNKEAEEHYRRAYELMPDSFGRVESHCFGCERAFAGKRAESVADKVFTQLVAKQPEKPQVHYLLGYLREEEDRAAEALPHFQQAVKLDPEYLNAWKHIGSVGQKMRLPATDRDAVALNILRLDPLGRHGSADFEDVTDLRALWAAVAAATAKQPPRVTELLSLPASKRQMELRPPEPGSRRSRFLSYRSLDSDAPSTPGAVVAKNRFVSFGGGMIGFSAAEMR